MTLTFRRNPVNYILRHELKNLRLGREDLREDLVKEDNTESNCLSAKDLETFDDDQKLQSDIKGFEKDEDEAEVVSDLVAVVESFDQNSKKLSPFEEAGLRLTLLQMKSFKHNRIFDQSFLAAESFGNANFLSLATEDLKSKFKDIKKNVSDIIKKIWEKVLEFLRSIFGKNERLKKEAISLIEVVKKSDLTKGNVISLDAYGSGVSKQSKVSAEILTDMLEVLTEIFEYNTSKIADAINGDSNDETAYRNEIKNNIKSMTKAVFKDAQLLNREAKVESKEKEFTDLNGNVGKILIDYEINDAWHFGVQEMDGIEMPWISKLSTPKLEEVETISKDEAIKVLNLIIKILDINVKVDTRTADKIISKSGKLKMLQGDNDLTTLLKSLGLFVLARSKVRYSTCLDIIFYIKKCLNSSGGAPTEQKNNEDKAL